MTTRGPATPDRRNTTRRAPAPMSGRRAATSSAVRRDGRSSTRVRPNRAAAPRPAIRRPSAGSPPPSATVRTSGVAGRLTVTTRAAILGLTLCLVALTMAYPLRAYLSQKAQISDLREQQRTDQQAVADLQRTIDRYRNPTTVQDEARARLNYQLPGEKVYLLPPPPAPASLSNQKVHTPAVPGKDDQAWYAQLWGSAVETSK